MKNRSIFKVLIAIILLLLLVWVFCLACCEVMTLIFCDGLMQMEDRPTMLTEPEYVKVLKYGRNSAKLRSFFCDFARNFNGFVYFAKPIDGNFEIIENFL